MPTARELLLNAQKGKVGSLADDLIDGSTITTMTAAASELNTACDKQDQRFLMSDAISGTAPDAGITRQVAFTERKVVVKSVYVLPNLAVGTSGSHYFTVQLQHVNSTNNGGTVTVASITTSVAGGVMTAGVPLALTITPSLAEVSANRVLQIAHVSTGNGSAWNYKVQTIVQEV